jgi:queuosine precursor transporter
MSKILPGVAAMAVIVLASNVLVQFRLGDWLTWGALSYPFAFLVTDLTNRLYGPAAARRVVTAGFVAGLACSAVGTQIEGAFGPLVTWRVALGSGAAFLCAQLLDIAVFDRLRLGRWWRAPLLSSLVGSAVDTALFFSIAFSAALAWIEPGVDVGWATEAVPLLGAGPAVPLWVSLGAADFMVKVALAMIALVPFRLLVGRLAASRT